MCVRRESSKVHASPSAIVQSSFREQAAQAGGYFGRLPEPTGQDSLQDVFSARFKFAAPDDADDAAVGARLRAPYNILAFRLSIIELVECCTHKARMQIYKQEWREQITPKKYTRYIYIHSCRPSGEQQRRIVMQKISLSQPEKMLSSPRNNSIYLYRHKKKINA